ncbi:hypothetical protein Cpir12675_002098 [Ceratocystis pirilliformis]|uniref:RNA 3'-terminal phosphate cyclase-like protein n=1 Tax=Ceratocystis pirilliformis TaxID=259994 RepID=A0ABR3ZCK3_9PEZI
MASTPEAIYFTGQIAFAQRLVLSTLTGRPVVISQIRNSSPTHPGLAPHEVSFLRLLDTVTNGSSMQISLTGTRTTFHPGLITGAIDGVGAVDGDIVEHIIEANNNRGVTYFLLPICLLAPFSKGHMNIRFTGPGVITSATETGDISVDTFRTSILPLFGLFGIPPARIELRIITRSCAGKNGRGGGGVVELRFASQVCLPKTLHLNRSDGRIRRIRGVAYCTGVSASSNNRMIQAAREILNPLVPDINIAAQYDTAPLVADKNGGKRRTGIGFGLSLVAESSSIGVIYSADVPAPPHGGVIPEDIGKQCAYQLLESISTGGCISKEAVPTVLTLMAMGSEDMGRVRLSKGAITPEFVRLARDLKQFGGSAWGIRPVDDESDDLIVSVKGFGVGNVARKVA